MGAINSIMMNGTNGGTVEVPDDLLEQIQNIKNSVDNIFITPLTVEQLSSFRDLLDGELDTTLPERVNAMVEHQLQNHVEMLNEAVQTLENTKTNLESSIDLAKKDIAGAKERLVAIGNELQDIGEDYTRITQTTDDLRGLISKKIDSSFFDLMDASLSKSTTDIVQSKNEIKLLAKEKGFQFSDDKVYDALAQLSVLKGEIEQRVTHEELTERALELNELGSNLLLNTRHMDNSWQSSNGNVQVLFDEFRNARIVKIDNADGYLYCELNGLEIGKTYTASINAKTSGDNGLAKINFHYDGESIELENGQSDTVVTPMWDRYAGQFVAVRESQIVSFRFTGLNNEYGYLAGAKVEYGDKARDWQPHVDDNHIRVTKAESAIKQVADDITAFARLSEEGANGDIEIKNTDLKVAADRFRAQQQTIRETQEGLREANSRIELAEGAISLKATAADIDNKIKEIKLDSGNRVLNSDFALPKEKGWLTLDSAYIIKEINGTKYAYLSEINGAQRMIATSNYFPVKNGERLTVSVEVVNDGTQTINQNMFSIHLFDKTNRRLTFKEFALSELLVETVDTNPITKRYYGSLTVDSEGVSKGQFRFHLSNIRNVGFTKVMVQSGSFDKVEWVKATGDVELITAEKFAEVIVEAGQAGLRAAETKIDEQSQLVERAVGELTVASDKISQFLVNENGERTGIDITDGNIMLDARRVYFPGEFLASKMTGGTLDLAQGFRLTNGSTDVIRAGADGNVELNVSKLTIGSSEAATKVDLKAISLTPGPRGVSIQSVSNYYLATNQSSGVTRSTSGWTTDVVSQQISATKQYLWNYEQTKFDNGTTNNTQPTIIGYWGRDGVSGSNGRGIKAITEYYLLNNVTTGVTHSTAGWTTATQIPTQTNRYVWNYEKIEYTDNSAPVLTTPKVIAMYGEKGDKGEQGVKGADGIGINNVVNYYKLTNTTTTPAYSDSGWVTTPPTTTPTNRFLWNYEKITYSNNEFVNTPVALIGVHGTNGANGADGRSITSVEEYYLASGADNGITRATTGWTTTVQKPTDTLPYLWNYEKINFSSGNPTYTEPILIGYKARDGRNGTDGIAGIDGVGIRSTTITYGLSTSDTVQPTSWTTQVPSLVKGQFLWTKTVWTYTNSTTETGYTKTYIARDGNNGTNGVAGKDGVGIRSTAVTYASSSSGTTQPTSGWQSQVPSVPNGHYLWTKTVWTYTDNTSETGYSVARMGADGAQGEKGDNASVNIMCGFTQGYSQRYLTRNKGAESITVLSDGWARLRYTNTTTSIQRIEYMFPKPEGITDGQQYTFLHEFRNNKSNANLSMYSVEDLDSAFFGNTNGQFQAFVTQSEKRYVRQPHHPNRTLEQNQYIVMLNINVYPNQTLDVEARVSCYVGDYKGPYIPYTGSLTGPQGATAYNHVAYIDASNTQTLDPLFNYGMNGIVLYNNANDGSLNLFREVNVPNSTQSLGKNRIRISHTKLGGSPGRGGVVAIFQGAPSSTHLIEFEAHAPVGSTLSMNNNALGTGGRTYWITDNKGIGAFKKYAYIVQYGTGTISTAGHISISHSEAVFNWYIANYQRYDITNKFSKEPIPNATHMGYQQTTSATQSSNISDYTWSSFNGSNTSESGGRNLMINSMGRLPYSSSGSSMTYTYNQSVSEWKAEDAVLVTGTKGKHNIFCYLNAGRPNGNLNENGTNYVHSIYIKNNGVPIQISNNMGTYVDIPSGTIARVVMKGMGTGSQSIQFQFSTTSTGNISFYYWHPQIEIGNIVSDWSPAIEDNIELISSARNEMLSIFETQNQENSIIFAKKEETVSLDTFQDFVEKYNLSQATIANETSDIRQSILSSAQREALITTILEDKAAEWIAKNTTMRMTSEGLTIGNKESGTYVLVSSDKIGFFNGSTNEVAYISNGMLYINQAVFVQSIQVSDFMWSSELPGHLTIRYVGN
ncbi:TPA: hypothetical protein ACGO1T_000534 [Streptococcus suis]